MLDKIIIKHLDKMQALEEQAQADIESIFKALDIDEVLDDPEGAMVQVATLVGEMIEIKILDECVKNGIEIAQKISELERDIKIQKTNDPKINNDK